MEILLFSDQDQLLEKTELALDKAGHQVMTVLQDHAAAEHLGQSQFDVVIIDFHVDSTSRMMVKDLVEQLQEDCKIVDGHLDADIIEQLPK